MELVEFTDGRDILTIEKVTSLFEPPSFQLCCYFEANEMQERGYKQIVCEYPDLESAYLNLESILSVHH